MTPGKPRAGKPRANELAVGDTAEAREDGYGLTAGQTYRVVVVHPPFVGVEDEDGTRYGVTTNTDTGELLGNILASRFRRVAVAEVDLGHGTEGLSVTDRDRLAIGHVKRARAEIEAALKAIPNHVESRFDTARDTRALDTIRRELVALELIEDELPPYEPRRSHA